jgi:hypothetical protein
MGAAFRSRDGFTRVYDLASDISWELELNSEIEDCHGDMVRVQTLQCRKLESKLPDEYDELN